MHGGYGEDMDDKEVPEREKSCSQGSIATRKVLCRTESFSKKCKERIFGVQKLNFGEKKASVQNLEYFRKIQKIAESLEDFRTVWRISVQSKIFLYSLGYVLDSLEDFRTIWKTSQ